MFYGTQGLTKYTRRGKITRDRCKDSRWGKKIRGGKQAQGATWNERNSEQYKVK